MTCSCYKIERKDSEEAIAVEEWMVIGAFLGRVDL